MKVFGMRRMGLLGIGFLLGSRAGRGPWNKAMDAWNQVQRKTGVGNGQSPKAEVAPGGKVMTDI
jgi:hypothetical protein